MMDLVVIGAGPAGVVAAMRGADLGAKTALVTSGPFGGMAANDGPVPVRTLAHAARLIRDSRQLSRYGIEVGEPVLKYDELLARVQDVVRDVREHSIFRGQVEAAGVTIYENGGSARFIDPNTVETESGVRISAIKFIICTGGVSRHLDVPGAELTNTHSDAWGLTSAPSSMIVVGAGATGAQVASIFNAFGTKVQLFQAGPRILPGEDPDISAAVAEGFRTSGIQVYEGIGKITSFESTESGVRMTYGKNGRSDHADAALAIVAIGWVANTDGLGLETAGVVLGKRGFIETDDTLQTSAPHIYAAGDVTGRMMLVPQAIQQGFLAATNAVTGSKMSLLKQAAPIGSFTDPEYAQVGLTEPIALENHDAIVIRVDLDCTTRTIVDGRTFGFLKLIVDRTEGLILGCHVVGERAVDLTQVAAVAMAAKMTVDQLANVPLSFPTYAGVLGRAAASAARKLKLRSEPSAN